jgi:hypothetical protein
MIEEDVRISISEDLKHIRHGPDDDIQHELRVLFNSHRREDLVRGLARKDTVTFCIALLKQRYPGWQPNIDKVYFDLE